MYRTITLLLSMLLSSHVIAVQVSDSDKVKRAVLDYIESQHKVAPEMMKKGLDKKLAKRTYWQTKDGAETIMETDFDTMVWVADNYNKNGDKFPAQPKIDIKIFDIDNRVASVKLTADEWIDYMHLVKNDNGEWKILNVLWQYHDDQRHKSKK
ncbi:nuclear transport factor 2 family protein [Thalassotalea atypica]|uniref:nuclear transport factor 2 family protein n=1 Tax=Thalassotalea atypica TaxID=2054316 RepID=UPI00257375C7|nr:nuclear transport factor 2 family protein [Thalassotalea atypica]